MKQKRFIIAAAIASLASTITPAIAADVGVSISVGQPGFYGRLDIGGYPQPVLVYPQPVIVQPVPVGVVAPPPVYLHVPPGHAKNWRKHCRKYNACGQPVYFVQDGWYNNVYVPEYRQHHYRDEYRYRGDRRDNGHRYGRDRGHDHDDDD